METILYLIRHGETDWNKARRIQGHSDITLNTFGSRQAELLALSYKSVPFDAVYSSDLTRAVHTALPLAEAVGTQVKTNPSLRERCYGDWEGLTYEEIRERFKEIEPDQSIYGIESVVALQQRAHDTLTELACNHPNQSVLVVSHGGLINAFLSRVTGGELGTGITRLNNTGVCQFHFASGVWKVLKINDTAHLDL